MSTDPTAGTTGQAAPDLDAIEEKWLRQCAAHDAGLAMSCTCPEGDPRNVIDLLVTEVRALRRAATYHVEREHLQWLAKCLGETQEALNVPGRLPALAPADVPARVRALLAENARLRQGRNEARASAESLRLDLAQAGRDLRQAEQQIDQLVDTPAGRQWLDGARQRGEQPGTPNSREQIEERLTGAEVAKLRAELDGLRVRYRELNEWAGFQAKARDGWDERARKAEQRVRDLEQHNAKLREGVQEVASHCEREAKQATRRAADLTSPWDDMTQPAGGTQ